MCSEARFTSKWFLAKYLTDLLKKKKVDKHFNKNVSFVLVFHAYYYVIGELLKQYESQRLKTLCKNGIVNLK